MLLRKKDPRDWLFLLQSVMLRAGSEHRARTRKEGQERESREPALGALLAACCARRAGKDQHHPKDDHLATVVYTKARVFSQCKPGPRVNQTQTWTSGFMK